jgi:hypothetical protein
VLGVDSDGVVEAGDGFVAAGEGLVTVGDEVVGAGVVGAGVGSTAPGDVVVVMPVGFVFLEVSGFVVSCAAAGTDRAASSTAARAYRCVMVELSCMMLGVFRLRSTVGPHSTADTMLPRRRIVIFARENFGR